ncbi:MAG: HAD family hydrolase, partial [Spirochaetota bacterium]
MEQDQPQGGRRPKEAGEERLSREAQPIQAVVFDLDGTLVDSEPNYRVTDERFVAAKGVPVSELDWDDIVGMGGGPFMELLRSRFGVEGSADGLLAEKDALYLDYAAGRTHAFPAMLELVRYLYVHGYSLAVGTSSQRKVLDASLAEAGLSGYFSATVSRDDVARSKPEPDTFLEAARRLDVAPHR